MKDSKKFLVVMIINVVLLVAAIIINIIGLNFTISPQLIVNLVAIAFAMAYLIFDYTKEGNKLFRLFVGFLAIKEIYAIVNMAMFEIVPWFAIVLTVISYSAPLLICLSKDFGAKKSYATCFVYIAVSIASLVYTSVMLPGLVNGGTMEGTVLAIYNTTRLILTLILLLMVYAKYQDKYSRGSK